MRPKLGGTSIIIEGQMKFPIASLGEHPWLPSYSSSFAPLLKLPDGRALDSPVRWADAGVHERSRGLTGRWLLALAHLSHGPTSPAAELYARPSDMTLCGLVDLGRHQGVRCGRVHPPGGPLLHGPRGAGAQVPAGRLPGRECTWYFVPQSAVQQEPSRSAQGARHCGRGRAGLWPSSTSHHHEKDGPGKEVEGLVLCKVYRSPSVIGARRRRRRELRRKQRFFLWQEQGGRQRGLQRCNAKTARRAMATASSHEERKKTAGARTLHLHACALTDAGCICMLPAMLVHCECEDR